MSEQEPTAPGADWPRPVVHGELVGFGGPEPGPGGHMRAGDHPGFSLYVQVRSLEESAKRVEALGGQVIRRPFDTPTGTTLGVIVDPEGNRVVLVQQ